MNPTSNIQNPKSSAHLPTFSPLHLSLSAQSNIQNPKSKFLAPLTPEPLNPLTPRGHLAAFTLVELLVVISIIGLLAGLAVPAINGALKSAKKSEVAAVAQSIRTAVLAYNSEYGTWPTNTASFPANAAFLNLMTTTTNASNIRGIIFLEVPTKFTNSDGIVTPSGYLKGSNAVFNVAVDLDGDGVVTAKNGTTDVTLRTAVAVWAPDASAPTTKSVGTWK